MSAQTINQVIAVFAEHDQHGRIEYFPDIMYQLQAPAEFNRPIMALQDAAGREHATYKDFGFPGNFRIPSNDNMDDWMWELLNDRVHQRLTWAQAQQYMVNPDGSRVEVARPNEMTAGQKKESEKYRKRENQHKARFRAHHNLLTWVKDGGDLTVSEVLTLEQIPTLSLIHNTSLAYTPEGLVKPHARLPNAPPQLLPLNTFRVDSTTTTPTYRGLSTRIVDAKKLLAQLQSKAEVERVPHWIFLRNRHKPDFWTAGTRRQHGQMAGADDIQVKGGQDMPTRAKAWIEQRIRQMEREGGSALDLGALKPDIRTWVERHMQQARKEAGVREGVYAPSTTRPVGRDVQVQYRRFAPEGHSSSSGGGGSSSQTSAPANSNMATGQDFEAVDDMDPDNLPSAVPAEESAATLPPLGSPIPGAQQHNPELSTFSSAYDQLPLMPTQSPPLPLDPRLLEPWAQHLPTTPRGAPLQQTFQGAAPRSSNAHLAPNPYIGGPPAGWQTQTGSGHSYGPRRPLSAEEDAQRRQRLLQTQMGLTDGGAWEQPPQWGSGLGGEDSGAGS